MRHAIGRPVPHHRPRPFLAGATGRLVARATLVALLASPSLADGARAQTVGPPAKHNNNTYGSPLDTFRSTHLWTDTPEPKDFVRESRPPAGALDYAPLSGSDPERAKPRDAANVAALQAELEHAGKSLAARSGRIGQPARQMAARASRRRLPRPDGAPPL